MSITPSPPAKAREQSSDMGRFSVEKPGPPGSVLSGDRQHGPQRFAAALFASFHRFSITPRGLTVSRPYGVAAAPGGGGVAASKLSSMYGNLAAFESGALSPAALRSRAPKASISACRKASKIISWLEEFNKTIGPNAFSYDPLSCFGSRRPKATLSRSSSSRSFSLSSDPRDAAQYAGTLSALSLAASRVRPLVSRTIVTLIVCSRPSPPVAAPKLASDARQVAPSAPSRPRDQTGQATA
jgi:hypothetical protein